MRSVLFAMLVALGMLRGATPADAGEAVEVTAAEAAATLTETAEPGTLIFSKGQCVYVTAYTGSDLTHVGIVAEDGDGQRFVFDSMKGYGVRKSSLETYVESMKDAELVVYPPSEVWTDRKRARLYRSLADDLGRPYDVTHYLTGHSSDGLHCSEYVTESLRDTGYVRASRPANISPAKLAGGIAMMRYWREPVTLSVVPPEDVKPTGLSCCGSFWWDTKKCCRDSGEWLSGLFLCR